MPNPEAGPQNSPQILKDILGLYQLVKRSRTLFWVSFFLLSALFLVSIFRSPVRYQATGNVSAGMVAALVNGSSAAWQMSPVYTAEDIKSQLMNEFVVTDLRRCETEMACLKSVWANPSDVRSAVVTLVGPSPEKVAGLADSIKKFLGDNHHLRLGKMKTFLEKRLRRAELLYAESSRQLIDLERYTQTVKGNPTLHSSAAVSHGFWRTGLIEPLLLEIETLQIGLQDAFTETKFTDFAVTRSATSSPVARTLASLAAIALSLILSIVIVKMAEAVTSLRNAVAKLNPSRGTA